jgi:c-di-GMP-binding flagellar brake protein YcgR
MDIRPGLSIRIVVDINHIKETTDVRNSIIFDIVEKKLIVAQTDPQILKNKINNTISVTYLAKEDREAVRYGFDATVVDIVKDYELSANNRTQAVILLKKSNPVEYNLRFFFRAQPPANSGISMSIHEKPVNILDISIGGAKISHNRELKLESGQTLELKLSIDGAPFNINATVVRTWRPREERMVKSLEFVALEFINTNMQFKNMLGKKIISIQRELRSKEIL